MYASLKTSFYPKCKASGGYVAASPVPRHCIIAYCVLETPVRAIRGPTEFLGANFGHRAVNVEQQEHQEITVKAALPCQVSILNYEQVLLECSEGDVIGEKQFQEKIKCNEKEKGIEIKSNMVQKGEKRAVKQVAESSWLGGSSIEYFFGSIGNIGR